MRTTNKLQGFHTLVITGASSGIGKSFLEHVDSMDSSLEIFNLSRSIPEGNFTHAQQAKLHHFPCDLACSEDFDSSLEKVLAGLESQGADAGPILLVNNAGFGSYGPFPEPSLERSLAMVDVNMRAPVRLAGALLPFLRRRGGAIINVASTAAFQPTPHMAVYGATKAFVLHWSLALGEELREEGIPVLALCPGPTSTQFFRNAGMTEAFLPDWTGQEPQEVVRAALRALQRKRSLCVSGWRNQVVAFFSAKLPKVLVTRLAARVIGHFRPVKARRGQS